MKLSDILLEGNNTHHDGVMVGLWIPPIAAKLLAIPGGENIDELHITLAYMGKGLSKSLVCKLEGVCASYATIHQPLSGRVIGVGRFPASEHSDGKEVLYAKPDIAGLRRFREGLVKRLKNAGGPVREDFDFTPHITLMYVQPGVVGGPVSRVALRFNQLVLAVGGKRRLFPLGGV